MILTFCGVEVETLGIDGDADIDPGIGNGDDDAGAGTDGAENSGTDGTVGWICDCGNKMEYFPSLSPIHVNEEVQSKA